MDFSKKTILIVDDESDILEFISYNLNKEGFNVHSAKSGNEALGIISDIIPDLVLLDVMMPGMDGIEVCERIRKNPVVSHILIAMLTARSESYSQIAGFDAGADDYIIKPIRPKLLVSRIKALLKRSKVNNDNNDTFSPDFREFGDIRIHLDNYKVVVDKKDIMLPKKEFQILTLLTSKPSRVFTRDEIYNHVWGNEVFVSDRTIDVYIRKLREKIGQDRIMTIKSVGYKFEAV
ncbi:MAG TPA: response regulator transcription factor [Bacteroidales bacterium]|nr:response regulator transcription factor [Bacteroidales bacterium]